MKTIILIAAIIIAFVATAPVQAKDKVHKKVPEGKVKTSYVCFVNNKYMGKEQIPVEVGGETYYGCCKGCVGNLKSNRKVRFAKDPLTGKEVDKAKAYIVTQGKGSKAVFYFKNKENYEKYKKKTGH